MRGFSCLQFGEGHRRVMRLRVQKGDLREQGETKKLLGRKGQKFKKCRLNRLFLVEQEDKLPIKSKKSI